MSGSENNKVPKYLFGAFCFYLLYFASIIFYLGMDIRWFCVPLISFAASLLILRLHGSKIEIQAYTVSVLTFINIFSYGVMLREFTEVFTVFCAAVCLISFYHILKANYLMLGLCTFFIIYELVWQGEWQNFMSHDSSIAVTIRIFSVYLVQLLMIMLIKRQQNIQRLAEQKASEAEAAAHAKEDFLANMSHEIRTPMNAITGMVELALRNDMLQDQEKEYLYNIRAAGEDLVSIIDDILDITKIDSGNLEITEEEYEITSLIHDAVNVIQVMLGDKQVVLMVNVSPDIPARLRGDGVRIKQIILNLLSNAAKYTEKGTIRMEVESIPVDGEEGRIDLKVCVTDTGIGMSEKQLEDLFTKFQQADGNSNRAKGGSGLGLAISKRLIELMQGSLHAKSEIGKGSEFVFTVRQRVIDARPCIETDPQIVQQPVLRKEENAVHRENRKQKGRQTTFTAPNTRILLVDDNKVNLRVAEGLLRPYKMCIEMAESGQQAIEMVQNRIYDLIFMDHMMPEMDGVEATKIIREQCGENGKKPVIIALTANVMDKDKEMFLENGFQDFLPKPVDRGPMHNMLTKWIPDSYKKEKGQTAQEEVSKEDISDLIAEGIDIEKVLEYHTGTPEDYLELLNLFYIDGLKKTSYLETLAHAEKLTEYRIEVHGLKSAAANLGAMELSAKAKAHEQAAIDGDVEYIRNHYQDLLENYRRQLSEIYRILVKNGKQKKEDKGAKQPITVNELYDAVKEALKLVENFKSKQCAAKVEWLLEHEMDQALRSILEDVQIKLKMYDDDEAEDLLRDTVIHWNTN